MEFKFRKALSVTECTAAIGTTQYNVVAQTMKRKYSELIDIYTNFLFIIK
jgi:hypothetical protein